MMDFERTAETPDTYHTTYLKPDPAREVLWRVLAGYLSSLVPPDSHVLELGAGYCHWINNVEAARRVAVDQWKDFPKHAAAGVEPLILDASQHLTTLAPHQFDVVLASNFLEHFELSVAERIVTDVFALLRPRGRFILIQPNFRYAWRRYFDDYTHRAVFTDISLCGLLRSVGFDIEISRGKFLPYSMREKGFLVAPWLIRAYLYSPIKPLAGQMLVVGRKA
jgi:SAM-dependent methyltransferase